MNNDTGNAIMVILVVTILIAGIFAQSREREAIKKNAVALGYAEYNKTNGNWQWIIPTHK